MSAPVTDPCICDGHYDGCEHNAPCGSEALNSRGIPMCDQCLPRRVARLVGMVKEHLAELRTHNEGDNA